MTANTLSTADLETAIQDALIKIRSNKEVDVCRYLPGEGGGYLHHLSFRHLKKRDPQKIQQMLDKHILSIKKPKQLPPRPRTPRGISKPGRLKLSKDQMQRIVVRLRQLGDKELVNELEPMVTSKTQIVKDLRKAISAGVADESLWEAFKKHVAK